MARAVQGSNARSASGAVIEQDLLDDMAAFDALPAAIRRRINGATVKFPSILVAEDFLWIRQQGASEAEATALTLRQIAINEAEIARADGRSLPKGHPFG